MTTSLLIIVCIVTLLAGLVVLARGVQFLNKHFDWLSRKFPRVISFLSGALIGVFAGVFPAMLLYAVSFAPGCGFVASFALGSFVSP